MLLLLLAALGAASPGLTAARAHLKSGDYDQLALDLDGATPDAERIEAAGLLAQAGQVARDKKDKVMALQLVQMAIRKDPHQTTALRLEAEMALEDEQITEAEHTSDALLAVQPSDPSAQLLRARVAAEAWDWDKVNLMVGPLLKAHLPRDQAKVAKDLDQQARDHRTEQDKEAKQLADIAVELRRAAEQAEVDRKVAFTEVAPTRTEGVILYGTTWCGFCKKAKAFLKARNVAFEEKDIERDHGARQEMLSKERAAGIKPGGIPVIDVAGDVVQGYDVDRIEALLHKNNLTP